MKKTILTLFIVSLLCSCGGGGGKESSTDTIVSPELKKLQKSSEDAKSQSEELNQKADSLLNNI